MLIPTAEKVNRNSRVFRTFSLILVIACLFTYLPYTVFAQTTYVITDGDQVTVHTSLAKNPVYILSAAGLELSEEDMFTTTTGDGVEEITVQRGQKVTLHSFGTTQEAVGYEETLEDLLMRLDIPAYGDNVVSLPLDTMVYEGMEVSIDHIVTKEEFLREVTPYETKLCYNPTWPEGEKRVLVEGADGIVEYTDQVVYTNGAESSRENLETVVVQEKVDQIVAIGTGTQLGKNENIPSVGDGFLVTAQGEILTFDKVDEFKATAYTKTDAGCNDITATGTYVHVGVIAVDPKVIPYGTEVFIVANDGTYVYGMARAEDCGGSIKNKRIDLYYDTTAECFQFGVRDCTLYFLT